MEPRKPHVLSNDCFALPPGVNWTPVDDALDRLERSLAPVVGTESLPLDDAEGRFLAMDAVAQRSNPPAANAAVDGYGLAATALTGDAITLPLVEGRAAAGAPFKGPLPEGHAVRILTGALLPTGVDTVVLQEDVVVKDGTVAIPGTVRRGANTRKAGEDIKAGDLALQAGQGRLSPADLALAAAVGLSRVTVFGQLSVGVLSTGDEVVSPGEARGPEQTYDANRPMLLALLRRWGVRAVDLGHVRDNHDDLAARITSGASQVHAIFTSGGASGGDEDHLAPVLRSIGTLETWRIAIKPGRPLALGLVDGVPVFGLPGNPVAAMVCTLIFGFPALSKLAGGPWTNPLAFNVPAAFSKRKKAGRREYLRARMTEQGTVEVFQSEGSGRISGLSWAEGLVELRDEAHEVSVGDPVRYLPFAGFGF